MGGGLPPRIGGRQQGKGRGLDVGLTASHKGAPANREAEIET